MYPVNPQIVSSLIRLNQRFYTACAQSFDDTRADAGSELEPAVELIRYHPCILDVGCGNGRLQRRYHQVRPDGIYVGIDFSGMLLEKAKKELSGPFASNDTHATFLHADIASFDWAEKLLSPLTHAIPFSAVAMLAVLHHIPSTDLRVQAIREAVRFLRSEGTLIISTWQFADNERMKRKIIDPRHAGINPGDLDPGDHILSWKRDGRGYRYCRHIDIDELHSLASSCGLVITRSFRAGGKEGNLSLFGILRPNTD